MLGDIADFAPETGNLEQEHYDELGVWLADSLTPFGTRAMVADLATAGFTLMGAALECVEAFTKLIIRNKPADMIAAENSTKPVAAEQDSDDVVATDTEPIPMPSRFLGCVQALPGEAEPPLPEKAQFHRAIFGWHPESMA